MSCMQDDARLSAIKHESAKNSQNMAPAEATVGGPLLEAGRVRIGAGTKHQPQAEGMHLGLRTLLCEVLELK